MHNANEVLVKVAYAIGVAIPVDLKIIVDKKEVMLEGEIYNEFSADKIRQSVKVNSFEETAKWGHFGNGFPWDIS